MSSERMRQVDDETRRVRQQAKENERVRKIEADNARLRKAIEELRCGCLYEDCYTSKWRNLCSIGKFKRIALEGGE